jgi:hypothetical protein
VATTRSADHRRCLSIVVLPPLCRFPPEPRERHLNRAGQWVERPELLKKVREWNVDPVDEAEAAAIAAERGR